MSWRDTIQPANPSGGWRSTIAPITTDPEEIERSVVYEPEGRALEAIGYNLGQGATLDNLDELLAGGKAALTPGDWQKLYDLYLQEQREYGKQLEEQEPVASTAGRLGGYLLPGIGAAKAAKAGTTLGRAGVEAGLGAIQGYGAAETQDEELGKMLTGAAVGGAGSAGFDVLGKLGRGAGAKFGDVVGNTVFGTPPEVSRALRANPRALDDVKSTDEIADILAYKIKQAQTGVSMLNENALETLKNKPLRKKQELIAQLEQLPESFGVVKATEDYPDSQAIVNEIQLARDAIAKSNSESDIKHVLRRLDQKAKFDTPSGDQINAVRKQIRGLIDRRLKSQNAEYESAMKPLAESTRKYKRALDESRLKKGLTGLEATDRTTQRLETLMGQMEKSKGKIAREDLEKVFPGINEELQKQKLYRQSEGGVTAGSRNVNLGIGMGGGILGEVTNYMTGGQVPPFAILAMGAVSGAYIDKYGRSLGSAIAKNAGRAGRLLDKYGDYFRGAANKELTHQFLMSVDPDYKAMFDELQGNFSNP